MGIYILGIVIFILLYSLFISVHGEYYNYGESIWTDIRDCLICSLLSWIGVLIMAIMFIVCFFPIKKKNKNESNT